MLELFCLFYQKMPKKFTLLLLYILTLLQSCFPIFSASYTVVAKVHLCPSSGTLVRAYRTLRPLILFPPQKSLQGDSTTLREIMTYPRLHVKGNDWVSKDQNWDHLTPGSLSVPQQPLCQWCSYWEHNMWPWNSVMEGTSEIMKVIQPST